MFMRICTFRIFNIIFRSWKIVGVVNFDGSKFFICCYFWNFLLLWTNHSLVFCSFCFKNPVLHNVLEYLQIFNNFWNQFFSKVCLEFLFGHMQVVFGQANFLKIFGGETFKITLYEIMSIYVWDKFFLKSRKKLFLLFFEVKL